MDVFKSKIVYTLYCLQQILKHKKLLFLLLLYNWNSCHENTSLLLFRINTATPAVLTPDVPLIYMNE